MSFSDIRDQDVPIRLLANLLHSNRVPNGLLFWGPEGVGKGLTALNLAQAVNCTEGSGDACGTCLSCRKTLHGNHPDVKVIAPTGKARNIAVDTVDFINELSSYRPFEGKWRVIIVEDVHRMGEPAQNHFLKTLEEPPSKTLFVLLTPFPRLLLPTVRSRCQQVRFGALRPETVADLLQRTHDLPRETALSLAAVAQGQMSRALDLVVSEKRSSVVHVLTRLAEGEDPMAVSEEFAAHVRIQQNALRAAAKAESENDPEEDASKEDLQEAKREQEALIEALLRRDLMEYLYLMQTWCRDELVYAATGNPRALLNGDEAERVARHADRSAHERLAAIDKAWLYIERNLSMDRVFRDLFFALAPHAA